MTVKILDLWTQGFLQQVISEKASQQGPAFVLEITPIIV